MTLLGELTGAIEEAGVALMAMLDDVVDALGMVNCGTRQKTNRDECVCCGMLVRGAD